MDDQSKSKNMQQIQVITGDDMSRGRYSNSMMATHSADEFILDWLLTSPTGAHLVSRIIVSPAHIKRIIAALKENFDNYEKQFGSVNDVNSGEQKFH
ncbi:MAG: DUF3467 domain-containing protein [Syntrophales bacterium]